MYTIMVIISEYKLIKGEEDLFSVQNIGDVPPCPSCGGKLAYRDTRKRICKGEGGTTAHIVIRRLRCTECNTIHNELPDCLVPHKHYATSVISGVLDGIITPDDDDSEDFPCQETMGRWARWFQAILNYSREPNATITFAAMRNSYQDWLERMIAYAPALFCQIVETRVK